MTGIDWKYLAPRPESRLRLAMHSFVVDFDPPPHLHIPPPLFLEENPNNFLYFRFLPFAKCRLGCDDYPCRLARFQRRNLSREPSGLVLRGFRRPASARRGSSLVSSSPPALDTRSSASSVGVSVPNPACRRGFGRDVIRAAEKT